MLCPSCVAMHHLLLYMQYISLEGSITMKFTILFIVLCNALHHCYSVMSCRVVSFPVVFCSVLSCRVLSCRVLSCRVPFRSVLFCYVLFCRVLFFVCPPISFLETSIYLLSLLFFRLISILQRSPFSSSVTSFILNRIFP